MLQGDKALGERSLRRGRRTRQIAEVLLASLTSDAANRKTLELVAEAGIAQSDLNPLFGALLADPANALDGVLDRTNMPLVDEPTHVLAELDLVRARF